MVLLTLNNYVPWFKEILLPLDEEGIIKFCCESGYSDNEDLSEFSESNSFSPEHQPEDDSSSSHSS